MDSCSENDALATFSSLKKISFHTYQGGIRDTTKTHQLESAKAYLLVVTHYNRTVTNGAGIYMITTYKAGSSAGQSNVLEIHSNNYATVTIDSDLVLSIAYTLNYAIEALYEIA